MYYVGIDIGGTKCAVSLANVAGEISIVDKEQFATDNLAPQVIMERFFRFIDERLPKYVVQGIGISCGGPLDSKNGVILCPPSLPKWQNIPIVRLFKERYHIPTYLQNDANACAVAEWRLGAGKGAENMLFLTFGTGLGAGLILGGRLYSGTNDNAGEIGHVRLTDNGPVGYGKAGSCEGYCSGSGIVRLAEIMSKRKNYASSAEAFYTAIGGRGYATSKEIARFAREGNAFCRAVFKKSGEMLGRTLSILVDILNPQRIILGGVYMRAEDLLKPHCERIMKKECLSYANAVVELLPAGLGERVGDFAAIAVAMGGY